MKTLFVFIALVVAYIVGTFHMLHIIKSLYPTTWLVLTAEQEMQRRDRERAAGKTKEEDCEQAAHHRKPDQ